MLELAFFSRRRYHFLRIFRFSNFDENVVDFSASVKEIRGLERLIECTENFQKFCRKVANVGRNFFWIQT